MRYLTEEKIRKILIFMEEINYTKVNLSSLLCLFEDIFEYSRSEIYLSDEYNNLRLIAYSNIDEEVFEEYWKYYHKYNTYWYPRIILSPKRTSVLRVLDAVSKDFYESSKFYTEYLKKYKFYHLISMGLIYQNEIFGCITFTRLEEENPFDIYDVMQLEIISRFLSPKILESLNENEVNFISLNYKKNPDNSIEHLLSKREKEVLNLVKIGLSNKEISSELFISINTVKTHLLNIYRKLDVSNRTELSYVISKNTPLLR